ncbi:hypothetical protein BDP27DRAFT_1361095 [Rhodocollybia butyracea]|uniref:Uncharacterized protein n=1 Tax=Rhodocollybia butyracea TaxID=206335 RepID=A0A9P5PTT8_9AGAR|nr:hypothetical protein BDP27DRAFT_1361095 [Rhodocollybia butyracea]
MPDLVSAQYNELTVTYESYGILGIWARPLPAKALEDSLGYPRQTQGKPRERKLTIGLPKASEGFFDGKLAFTPQEALNHSIHISTDYTVSWFPSTHFDIVVENTRPDSKLERSYTEYKGPWMRKNGRSPWIRECTGYPGTKTQHTMPKLLIVWEMTLRSDDIMQKLQFPGQIENSYLYAHMGIPPLVHDTTKRKSYRFRVPAH